MNLSKLGTQKGRTRSCSVYRYASSAAWIHVACMVSFFRETSIRISAAINQVRRFLLSQMLAFQNSSGPEDIGASAAFSHSPGKASPQSPTVKRRFPQPTLPGDFCSPQSAPLVSSVDSQRCGDDGSAQVRCTGIRLHAYARNVRAR